MVTVHNGISDLDPPGRNGLDEDLRVISVARFAAPKDHETLLRAVAAAPNVTLDLVGDGPEEDAAKRLAASLSLADRVRFLGRRTDVAELLAQAHLFALCSRSEGFPISTLEAMRAGLPVIVSNVGGAPEAVADGVSGIVVHDNTMESWAGHLTELAGQPDRLRSMGDASRARYLQSFTFDRMYEETMGVYGNAVKRLPAPDHYGEVVSRMAGGS
jgi:glycosyltransferase involved in cell wall biosynthesis